MAFRKIIKTGDPDDIRTGFAGAVWDIVKMSSLIGAFVAFFSGMVLKGKLLMLAAESWTSISLVLLVLFLALFLSLGAVLLQLPGLIHRKREHQEAQSPPCSLGIFNFCRVVVLHLFLFRDLRHHRRGAARLWNG